MEAEVGYSDEVLIDSVEHERKLLQYRREKGGVGDDVVTLSLPAMACGPTGRRHAEALRDAVGIVKGGKRYTTVRTLYNHATNGSCYLFTGTENDMINAEVQDIHLNLTALLTFRFQRTTRQQLLILRQQAFL